MWPVDREVNDTHCDPAIVVAEAVNSARAGPVGTGVGVGEVELHEKEEGIQAEKASSPSISRTRMVKDHFILILYHRLPVYLS